MASDTTLQNSLHWLQRIQKFDRADHGFPEKAIREFVLSCHNFVAHLPPKHGSELVKRSECLSTRIHRDSEFEQARVAALSEFNTVFGTDDCWPQIRKALEQPDAVWELHSHQQNVTEIERYGELAVERIQQTLGTAYGFRQWHLLMKSLQILEQENRAIGSQLLMQCHQYWYDAANGSYVEKFREFRDYLLVHFDQCRGEIILAADALVECKPTGKRTQRKKQHQTDEGEETSPQLTVNSWNDLGIGIHPDGRFLALPERPDCGSRVIIGKATSLRLAGTRWKKVMNLLAKSEFGNTANVDELIIELKCGKIPPETGKLTKGQKQALLKTAQRELVATMADLGRKFRETVHNLEEDEKKNKKTTFHKNGDCYVSVFVVRHLIEADRRNWYFRETTTRWLTGHLASASHDEPAPICSIGRQTRRRNSSPQSMLQLSGKLFD